MIFKKIVSFIHNAINSLIDALIYQLSLLDLRGTRINYSSILDVVNDQAGKHKNCFIL